MHNVLVGAEHLVPNIKCHLKAKGGYLLVDHHFADVVLYAHFMAFIVGGLVLWRNLFYGLVMRSKPSDGCCCVSAFSALQNLRVRGARLLPMGPMGSSLYFSAVNQACAALWRKASS